MLGLDVGPGLKAKIDGHAGPALANQRPVPTAHEVRSSQPPPLITLLCTLLPFFSPPLTSTSLPFVSPSPH